MYIWFLEECLDEEVYIYLYIYIYEYIIGRALDEHKLNLGYSTIYIGILTYYNIVYSFFCLFDCDLENCDQDRWPFDDIKTMVYSLVLCSAAESRPFTVATGRIWVKKWTKKKKIITTGNSMPWTWKWKWLAASFFSCPVHVTFSERYTPSLKIGIIGQVDWHWVVDFTRFGISVPNVGCSKLPMLEVDLVIDSSFEIS